MQPRTRAERSPDAAETLVFGPGRASPAGEALPFAASAAFHGLLLVALAHALPLPALAPPPPIESLAVELLSAEEIAALIPPPKAPPETPPEPAVLPPPPPSPGEPPLVLAHAETLYSATTLDRVAQRDLGRMAVDTRFEQLCDIEAMEQIARGQKEFKPERAVAYAASDVKVLGNLMIAEGAAFLSEGQWYQLSFRCEASPDRSKVVSFDFATGGIVTEGRGLGDGSAD